MRDSLYFHGSYEIIESPDLDHSRSDIDFGKGFYLTQDDFLAKKWACKKRRISENSVVNAYSLDMDGLDVFEFDLDKEWLDFVVANRNEYDYDKKYDQYDVLIGAIANDKLFDIIDLYDQGVIAPENAIRIMNNMDYGRQIAIKSERAIRKLEFRHSKELKGLEKQNLQAAFRNDTELASKKAEEMLRRINRGIST